MPTLTLNMASNQRKVQFISNAELDALVKVRLVADILAWSGEDSVDWESVVSAVDIGPVGQIMAGAVANAFCPTGKGGGRRNDCPPPNRSGGALQAPAAKVKKPAKPKVPKKPPKPKPPKPPTKKQLSEQANTAARALLAGGKKLNSGQSAALGKHLAQMTVAQLNKLKKDHGIKVTGKKADLAKGLAQALRDKLAGKPPKPVAKPKPPPKPTPKPKPVKPAPDPAPPPAKPKPKKKGELTDEELNKGLPPVPPPVPPMGSLGPVPRLTPTDPGKPTGPLRHPEMDPGRAPLVVGGFLQKKVSMSPPRTKADLDKLARDYDGLTASQKAQAAKYFGVNETEFSKAVGYPMTHEFRAYIEQKATERINTPIGERLKNSPHEAFRQHVEKIGTHVEALESRRKVLSDRGKEIQKKTDEAFATYDREPGSIRSNPKKAAAYDEYRRLQKAADANHELTVQANNDRMTAETKIHAAIKEHLAPANPGRVSDLNLPDGQGMGSHERGQMGQARDFLDGAVVAGPGQGGIPPTSKVNFDEKNTRAFYNNAEGGMTVGRAIDSPTVVHEYGHHMENKIPGAASSAREFLDHRVGDERPIKLKDKFPGYGDSETGRKDDFEKTFGKDTPDAYYVGKDYGGSYTEITSMGVQQLYSNPAKFAKSDPEYFNFVMGQLSGEHRNRELPD